MSRNRQLLVVALLVLVALGTGAPVRAAEVTRVVSALDDTKSFDFNLSLAWLNEQKTASIKRESQSALSPGRTELVKDLRFIQTRNVMILRADIGILWDLGLHVEAPLVLQDARRLDFDQTGGSDCVYPGDSAGRRATCVNENNSSVLRDGVLPGFGAAKYGFDAEHKRAFDRPSTTVFRGPARSGIEYLGLGATWAILNQARDDTKPTWTVTFDTRLSVGKDMRYDPASSGANTGVGRGYHELFFATYVSKRFRHFDPYFGVWYAHPIRTNGSPFEHYAPGSQGLIEPQQKVGVNFGTEHIVWEQPALRQKVSLEYRGRMELRFEGRAQSEIWEALAGSSKCRTDMTACRLGLDQDLDNSGKPDPYPGVTDVETYGVFGGDVGINVKVGPLVRFRGLFGMALEQPHFLSFANAGADTNKDGLIDTNNKTEANPVYREGLDLPGRRFRVDQTRVWTLMLDATMLF